MNNDLINLLNKYNSDTKIIDISNKNIEGILDLSNFIMLRELYCQHNKITQIIFPNTFISYLDCSHNKIIKLSSYRLEGLTGIRCNSNLLTELYYTFDERPDGAGIVEREHASETDCIKWLCSEHC